MEELSHNLSDKAQHDCRLVKLALENSDQQAYAELMGRYRDSVYFMLLKMVNNKDDADDLTIEAFGRAFKRLHQYTPNFAFSTWLFKIASNNAIDHLRKKKQGDSYSLDTKFVNEEGQQLSQNIKSGTLDPEENFIKKQKIELLHDVVDKLKPKYKELVEMFYYQEMSHEEISQKLNLPIGTIKAQLFRARELLYTALKGAHGKM